MRPVSTFGAMEVLWGTWSAWPGALGTAPLESQICPCHKHTHTPLTLGQVTCLSSAKTLPLFCSPAPPVPSGLVAPLPPPSQPRPAHSLNHHTHMCTHTHTSESNRPLCLNTAVSRCRGLDQGPTCSRRVCAAPGREGQGPKGLSADSLQGDLSYAPWSSVSKAKKANATHGQDVSESWCPCDCCGVLAS